MLIIRKERKVISKKNWQSIWKKRKSKYFWKNESENQLKIRSKIFQLKEKCHVFENKTEICCKNQRLTWKIEIKENFYKKK